MAEFNQQLRLLLSDRTSPEARALYVTIAKYVHGRVQWYGRHRYRDVLSNGEVEDLVGDVLFQLMTGSLAQFRGETLRELLGYVRTITDRTVWRVTRRRIEERNALQGAAAETVRSWTQAPPGPEQAVRILQHAPLAEKDQAYLRALLAAGSKSEYARRAGVSRAAVTQRVQRIRSRIDALTESQRGAVQNWLEVAAHRALAGRAGE